MNKMFVQGPRCIGCGCTETAPCLGMLNAGGTCFWTWVSEDEKRGLCSACATKPIEQLQIAYQVSP